MLKFTNIGDIHLYDREIGATVGYDKESTRNLIKINDYFDNNEDIYFLVLGGDIQHGMPESLKRMSEWRTLLKQLGDKVRNRLESKGLLDILEVYDHYDERIDLRDSSVLFSLKGNHDYNRREDRRRSFTFFDDLVDVGIISVPKYIVYEGTQINLYSNGEFNKPNKVKENIETIISIYHDPIIQNGVLYDKYMGKMISPDEHNFFSGVDLAILNDIHLPIDTYKVTTVGEDNVGTVTTVITPGSIGRTSFSDSHKRDYALLCEVEIGSDNDVGYDLYELELLPYKKLFDYEKAIKVKNRENMFEEFNLEIESVDRVIKDPRQDIRDMELDEKVKKECLSILDEVIEGI